MKKVLQGTYVMELLRLLVRGLRNPAKATLHIFKVLDNKLGITEVGRVSEGGQRIVVKDFLKAKASKDFSTLAHVQRYEWCLSLLKEGTIVLDAGCGSGYGTHFLAKNAKIKAIVGIDISPRAISFANKHFRTNNCIFLQMDVTKLKFRYNFFDAVISFDVIEHLSEANQRKFIDEVRRIVKPTGMLIIGCPNAKVSMGNNPFHVKELTMSEFHDLLHQYFEYVKLFGQDLMKRGKRAKERWWIFINDLSYNDLVIVEEDCDLCFGLLAVCKNPRK